MQANANRLNDGEISHALSKIPGWNVQGGKLHREYRFVNFAGAFSFMVSSALIAQELNRYPQWFNAEGIVSIDLGLQDSGITELDAKLAFAMDEMAQRQQLASDN
jgi:4a-hydroxytetrahydrobiopterin dehydratase